MFHRQALTYHCDRSFRHFLRVSIANPGIDGDIELNFSTHSRLIGILNSYSITCWPGRSSKSYPTLSWSTPPGIVASRFIKKPTTFEWILMKRLGRTPEIGARVIALATLLAKTSAPSKSELREAIQDES